MRGSRRRRYARRLRVDSVPRWAGLLAWAAICLELLLLVELPPAHKAIVAVGLAAFGAGFVWAIGPGRDGARPRTLVAVMLALSLCGTFLTTDLSIIVAFTLPFVFARRTALAWILVRNALALPWFVYLIDAQQDQAMLPPGLQVMLVDVLGHLAWQAFAFASALLITAAQRGQDELARANAQLRAAQQLLDDRARLAERVAIARELHDALGHHLAALNVQLELARHLAEGPARAAIAQAHATGRRLLDEVREVVSTWRGGAAFELLTALDELASEIRDPVVTVAVAEGLELGDSLVARTLFRCAQEAVTNAIRHAGARHVWIDLGRDDARVRLRIRDDGPGTTPIVVGNGLRGLRERAEALAGTLELCAVPGQGVTVEVVLPLGRVAP